MEAVRPLVSSVGLKNVPVRHRRSCRWPGQTGQLLVVFGSVGGEFGDGGRAVVGSSPCLMRPTADFKPSVWGDFFLHYSPSFSMGQISATEQRVKELKEEVKTLFSTNDLVEKLTLVDDLHRLGIYYHFKDEIREAITSINDHVDDDIGDIRLVALRFRLLRQEGYVISPGVFSKFKDSEGKFKQELSYDVEGLLQLYEASMLGTNDEPILKEATDFARGHLKRIKREEPHTAQIGRALETPFHRGMRRLEARLYIPMYAKSNACITILLELAKLDFNRLQSIHQAEIQRLFVYVSFFIYFIDLFLVSPTHPWYS